MKTYIKEKNEVDYNLFSKDVNDIAAKYGLPQEVKFCKKCVISNQRPNSEVEFQHNKTTNKKTILLATHHINEIPPEIERVILIKEGKIFDDDKKEILFTDDKISEFFNIPLKISCLNGYYQVCPVET